MIMIMIMIIIITIITINHNHMFALEPAPIASKLGPSRLGR